MIRNLLFVTFLFSGFSVFSQAFTAVYPFTAVTPTTGVNDPTPPPIVTGITFGSFSSIGTATAPSTSSVFSFNSWGTGATNGNDTLFTGAINPNKYYEVTITPNVTYSITINTITFSMLRSTTGPRNWAVRSNRDSYTANLPASITTNSNLSVQTGDSFFWNLDAFTPAGLQQGSVITLSGANFTDQTIPYVFRIYAWNAESTVGTFRVDNVTFKGIVNSLAGINEITQDINSVIKIYPNPSNDGIIYFDSKNIKISKFEIINLLGEVVISETKSLPQNEKIKLTLNNLPIGTYFIRLSSENKVYSERFFISK